MNITYNKKLNEYLMNNIATYNFEDKRKYMKLLKQIFGVKVKIIFKYARDIYMIYIIFHKINFNKLYNKKIKYKLKIITNNFNRYTIEANFNTNLGSFKNYIFPVNKNQLIFFHI